MQNLRTTLNDTALPPAIQDIVKAFDKNFGSDVHGTLMSDQLLHTTARRKAETTSLTKEVRNLFLSWFSNDPAVFTCTARLHQRLDHRGYTFAVAGCSIKDSYIMFQSPHDKARLLMGSIRTILSLHPKSESGSRDEEIYFVVNQYHRVAEGVRMSIFQEFRSVLGALFSSQNSTTTLVRLDEVKGQFCRVETEYGDSVFQALPMNKVRLPSTSQNS